MKKTLIVALAVIAGLVLAPLGLRVADKIAAQTSITETLKTARADTIPASEDSLLNETDVKLQDVKKNITLELANTVTLRGPVTGTSVAKAMKELQAASRRVSKNTPLYLVLDTPGGSIMDGEDLIQFAKALPHKVNTITLFAASMGFQIAQNLDTRYIVSNGTLMSHRATVSGMGGQIKGEFETRYRMIRRDVDYLDFIAAKRMGMETKAYEQMVFNEYWVYGFDAVQAKAADEQVLVQCGESLKGTDDLTLQTIFGAVTVKFSKCPLIKEPEAVDFGNIPKDSLKEAREAITSSLTDEVSFVNKYIVTSRFYEIFK